MTLRVLRSRRPPPLTPPRFPASRTTPNTPSQAHPHPPGSPPPAAPLRPSASTSLLLKKERRGAGQARAGGGQMTTNTKSDRCEMTRGRDLCRHLCHDKKMTRRHGAKCIAVLTGESLSLRRLRWFACDCASTRQPPHTAPHTAPVSSLSAVRAR